ncbi:hypothetical protein KSP39_PZI009203 [Platanthera zijinensis]|uniref:Uncharacterized protein n=1 Tax=Platanthera zijinensis TaxID=2320716 RepID=A0AAP0BKE1_9ASPA
MDLAIIITVVQPDKHILTMETNEESIKNIEKYSNNLTGTFNPGCYFFMHANSFQHFNHESEHNAEVSFQVSPGKCSNKDDNFEQNPPGPCHILKNLNDNDVF